MKIRRAVLVRIDYAELARLFGFPDMVVGEIVAGELNARMTLVAPSQEAQPYTPESGQQVGEGEEETAQEDEEDGEESD